VVDDFRAGLPASTAMNLARSKESDPVMQPLDMIPWIDKPEPEPASPERVAENVINLFNRMTTPKNG